MQIVSDALILPTIRAGSIKLIGGKALNFMKKFFIFLLCLLLALAIAGCGNSEGLSSDSPTEQSQAEEGAIVPNDVAEGSEADIAVRAAVKDYIDTFISCDFDRIESIIHEEDLWLFNFESEDQIKFYNAIFPCLEYEFDFVSEHEGVYGVMAHVYAPDMAEVYGTVIADYIDASTGNSSITSAEIVSNNTERMLELIASPETSVRDERLYIYVQHIDGEYIVRCDMYLANALTGGAPEVSEELAYTFNETISALSE